MEVVIFITAKAISILQIRQFLQAGDLTIDLMFQFEQMHYATIQIVYWFHIFWQELTRINVLICWRLNSAIYKFEQAQKKLPYRLIHATVPYNNPKPCVQDCQPAEACVTLRIIWTNQLRN